MCNDPELGCQMPDQRYNPGKSQVNLGVAPIRTAGDGLGQLQIRQFGTLWWHLCLIVMQGRMDLTEEDGETRGSKRGPGAAFDRLSRSTLGGLEIRQMTVTGRRVCVCKEKAEGRGFIRN